MIRVGGLKGPTTMGLVKLMDDAENGKAQNDYEFTMVTAADELTALVAGNKVDIALFPPTLPESSITRQRAGSPSLISTPWASYIWYPPTPLSPPLTS